MSTTQNLNSIVNYQEGSVVSKELIKKPTGNITLFAFDKDQGLSEHTAPFDAMVVVTDGIAEVTVSGVVNQVKAGDVIIMPANAPHSVKAAEQLKMMLIMIKS